MRVLTVTNPFAGYATGDPITDPAEVAAILAGEHSGHVVATDRPDPVKKQPQEEK